MLLSPTAYRALLNTETITPRILMATFEGNPKTTVISSYSPTDCTEDKIAEEFYTQLQTTLNQIPKHNVSIIAGDMNAKVGREKGKNYSYHDSTNRNGQLLLNLMEECNLIDLSTRYCKKSGKLWTFTYPNGCKAQLDHILSVAISCVDSSKVFIIK